MKMAQYADWSQSISLLLMPTLLKDIARSPIAYARTASCREGKIRSSAKEDTVEN